MNLSVVKMGYLSDLRSYFIRELKKIPAHPKQVLYQAEPHAETFYLPVITIICTSIIKVFVGSISAHTCSKMHHHEGNAYGKIGVFSQFKSSTRFKRESSLSLSILSASFRIPTIIFANIGGVMTTTAGQLKKTKETLQKLREKYLRSIDKNEKHMLAVRIDSHKKLIEQLGVENG